MSRDNTDVPINPYKQTNIYEEDKQTENAAA